MRKLFMLLLVAPFSFGQYCTNVGPSSTVDSNLEWLILNGQSGGINYTGCPGQTGLEEYIAQSVSLQAGSSYTLNLQFGTCGGNYAGVGQVWIDFNHNFVFEAGESIGTWQGTPPTAASVFNFTVPAGATVGPTRMRVMQAENASIPMNPCATFAWGSVTDFNITITSAVDCSTYLGDAMNDPKIVSSLPYTDIAANTVCYTDQHDVYPSSDVFYKVAVNGLNSITASLCNSSFDTFITATDKYGNTITANDDSPNCDNGNAEITFNSSPYDSVYIIVEGWGSQSGNYELNINQGSLEISETMADKDLIYPNPSNSGFYISNDISGILYIIDASGQRILEQSHDNPYVSTHDLDNGIYFVIVKSSTTQYSTKLIVNHE